MFQLAESEGNIFILGAFRPLINILLPSFQQEYAAKDSEAGLAVLVGLAVSKLCGGREEEEGRKEESYQRIVEEIRKIPTVDANDAVQKTRKGATQQVSMDETQLFPPLSFLKYIFRPWFFLNKLKQELNLTCPTCDFVY